MDVVLVSGRAADRRGDPSRAAVSRLAARLADSGARVRWLCPRIAGEPPEPARSGVCRIDVPTRRVASRRVQAQVMDPPLERALSIELRRDPPDLLHVHGFGAGFSYLSPWLAARLGVPAVVVAAPLARVLCPAGMLIDETGSACDAWDRAACCQPCTLAGGAGGRLGSVLAAGARMLGPLSPYPRPADFENRLDMVVQGLASAAVVCVEDAEAGDRLVGAGVPRRAIRIAALDAEPESWLALHAVAAAASSST